MKRRPDPFALAMLAGSIPGLRLALQLSAERERNIVELGESLEEACHLVGQDMGRRLTSHGWECYRYLCTRAREEKMRGKGKEYEATLRKAGLGQSNTGGVWE